MAEETVKEFLVSIGWKTNENDHAKFERMIEHATLRAKLLGDALEEMARKGFESVQSTAERYESLFFSAERMHTSVQEIQALQYAFSQLGGTASGAQAVMEKMAAVYQRNPGSIKALEHFGFEIDKVTHKLVVSGRTAKEMLGEKDSTTVQWAGMAGLSEEEGMFIKRHFADILKYMNQFKEAQKGIGFDPDEGAKKAEEFKSKWNETLMHLRSAWDKLYAEIAGWLVGPLEKLNEFLKNNEGPISKILEHLSDLMVKLLEGWVKSFEEWVKKPEVKTEIETFFDKVKDGALAFGAALNTAIHDFEHLISLLDDKVNPANEGKLPGVKVEDKKPPEQKKSGGFLDTLKSMFGFGDAKADSLDKGAIKTDGVKVGTGNPLPVKIEDGLLSRLKKALGIGGGGAGGGGGGPGGGGLSGVGAGAGGGAGYLTAGGGLTPEQGAALLRSVGASPEEAAAIASHMGGESRGNPTAYNFTGPDLSYGLWQINMKGAMGPERRRLWGLKSNDELYDPPTNAKAALWLYRHGGLSHWRGSDRFLNREYSERARRAAYGWKPGDYPLTPKPNPKATPLSPNFTGANPGAFTPTPPKKTPHPGDDKTSFNQNVKVHVTGGEPGGLSNAVGAGPRNTASDMTQQFNSAVG